MKLLTIGLLSLTLMFNAFAEESKICHIVTDIDAEQTQLLIETDSSGNLDSIRLYKTKESSIVSDDTHPIERAIADGIVASVREGREIVILRADAITVTEGGIIALDYLYNGITGSRRNYKVKLTKVEGKFVLTTVEGVKINHLFFIGNRAPLIGKVIGIKEVRASFK